MGIAKSLTNDLERALRLYRIPILTAIALSLRRNLEDRFLLTDDRSEDERRNVVRLRRVTAIEQASCKPGIGVDERQFTALTGNLLFTGLKDENGIVQPIYNLSNSAGRKDLDGIVFTATGTPEEKVAKARRYNKQRPGDVNWKVRTPVMMADSTTVIDYLMFRCTQLRYLHSISLKWSDRRWDANAVPIDQDLYRPDGERSHMVTIAPMWMDDSMTILNPEVWGPFESLIQANYEEALGRKVDEMVADCAAFLATYKDYIEVLTPSPDAEPATVNAATHGRMSRLLNATANRTLHIPFNRAVVSQGGEDSYRISTADPETAQDVTQDVFNLRDPSGNWLLTSSFEGASLADDGWCVGPGAGAYANADIPEGLPAFTHDKAGNPVFGQKSIQVSDGYICRRIVLPNGLYALRLWVKTKGSNATIEVIRNNRLRPKGWAMNPTTERVTSIKHWRENYETVAISTIQDSVAYEWRQFFISFYLKDSLIISGEGYPAHEIYIVLTSTVPVVGAVNFDHLELFQDRLGHSVSIINTVNRSSQPFNVRPELRHVNLELAFEADTPFGTREVAAACFKLDGRESVVEVEHRESYNIRPTGTTIDAWFKVNSTTERDEDILGSRGSFTLFQKSGAYLPGYACVVNRDRLVTATVGAKTVFSSRQFRNTMLHPSVGNASFPPRTDWTNPNIYTPFWTAYRETGLQPTEWTSITDPNETATVGVAKDLGGDKFLLVASNDPYLVSYPGSTVRVLSYLSWHARRAYGMIMPADQVSPGGMEGGFVFCPIPINSLLSTIGKSFGNYSPSPSEFSPRYLYSPGSPMPSFVFTPDGTPPPSPNTPGLEPIPWPLSPSQWGDVPVPWPTNAFLYGSAPAYDPLAWSMVYDDAAMQVRHPMFVAGVLKFDRWFHFNMAISSDLAEVGIQGMTVFKDAEYELPGSTESNGDDLLIGTSSTSALRVSAPISVYSFKVYQYHMPAADRMTVFTGEAINFNELQYNVYKDNLDYDGDRVLDFWQDDITDYGLWTKWPSYPKDPNRPYPTNIEDTYGTIVASVSDPISIATDLDRNRNILADWYDESYLQELIDIQAIGFADGLIMCDFAHPDQAATYDYKDRVWDPVCNIYRPRTLSYLDWLRGVLTEEWNQITSVHDPMPGFAEAGSPSPWASGSPNPEGPWPSFGTKDNQLVMTGVKGWFGWNGLLGYRDSLALVAKEGIVFNYLQIEFHFRAPRSELEALLRPFAHSIDQIFEDDYQGNHLTKQVGS